MSQSANAEGLATIGGKAQHASGWTRLLRRRELTVVYAIIALSIVIQLVNHNFATLFNFQVMVRQIAIFGLISLGEMIVIITAGIDLSMGSVVALVGVVEAMLVSRAGWPPFLSLGAGLVAAVLIGAYHGVAVSKWAIPSFIITLGSLSLWRGLATGVTRSYPILIADEHLRWIGQGIVLGVPAPLIILVLVAVVVWFVLNSTSFGRNIYAVGGNIEAARLSGIPVARVLIGAYTLASLLAGVAGVIVAGRMAQGLPSVAGGYELNAIAAAIIGGTSFFGGVGTVPGVLLGSAFMVVIDNSLILMNVSAYWYTLVVGSVIVLAVTIDVVSTKRRRRAEELMGV
jgi:ribose transport system permease protein